MSRLLALVGSVLLCCSLAATAVASKKRPLQHVTIFSDSVGASLNWDSTAKHIVEHGDRVLLELRPCGRLVQAGCLATDPPPSVLETVRTLGRKIGPNVVVFIGYNDDPAAYRHGIPEVLAAMRNHGVKHVLWLTLRATSQQYIDINHAIYAAQQRWRSLLTVLDWNHYSAGRLSWFAADGVHMTGAGAIAFATYLHRSLRRLGLTGPMPTG
ncbi:MAG TPA: hypothetical protein VE985_10540 [Gaiellaceae bacterium]|nr:hypothetical protein [Gaiellaceae bacterium]